jgi:hypothetical protein
MRFKTTTLFDKKINKLLTAEEYRQLRQALAENPRLGVVIKGTGGIRKMRWAVGQKGKSGGARIIYYWHLAKSPTGEIYLLFAFLKSEQDNLTGQQKMTLKKFIQKEYQRGQQTADE